jgi:hypothetical protein
VPRVELDQRPREACRQLERIERIFKGRKLCLVTLEQPLPLMAYLATAKKMAFMG